MQRILERYGMGIVVGSAVTVGLLYLMQAAISNDHIPLNDPPGFEIVEVVRILEDIEPIRKPPKEKPPPPPDEMPPDIPIDGPVLEGGDWSIIVFEPENSDGPVADIGSYSRDGEYLPIAKVRADYPRIALKRGIEGYVILQFTVTEKGTVEDPEVVESAPPGIFDAAAIKAALKFNYKPRVVDGTPIRVSGVKNKIVFKLED